MSSTLQLTALMPLIRLASRHLDELPPEQRADVYEGIAIITAPLDATIHQHASHACSVLRDAESAQLTFTQFVSELDRGAA
jgi:hypothetical protein